MDRSVRGEKFLKAGLMGGIGLFLLLIFYVNIFHFNYKMNADIAAEAILGKVIWESKEWCPKSWYPSSEARIISAPNVAALFYGITGNMSLAMGLACCFMTVLILANILFFCRSAGIEGVSRYWMLILCMALPVSFDYLELIYMFACYYAIQIAVLFFTLGVYASVMRTGKIRYGMFFASIIFSLLLGFQGARGILVLYGPLFGTELFRNIMVWIKKQKRSRADILISIWTLLLLGVSFWGNSFPFSVEQSFSRNIRRGFDKMLTVVLPDMGDVIGLNSENILRPVCLGGLVLLAIFVAVNILWRIWRDEKTEPEEWAYLVMFISPVLTALAIAFTTIESSGRYYFMLYYVMAFAMSLFWNRKNMQRISGGIAVVAVFVMALNIWYMYCPVFTSEEPPVSDTCQAANFLRDNNYHTAYATFENAHSMTIFTNGSVTVAPVASVSEMDICKWLSSSEWYPPNVPYNEAAAYVITEHEEEEFQQFLAGKEDNIREKAEIGKYRIYVSDYNYVNLGGTE